MDPTANTQPIVMTTNPDEAEDKDAIIERVVERIFDRIAHVADGYHLFIGIVPVGHTGDIPANYVTTIPGIDENNIEEMAYIVNKVKGGGCRKPDPGSKEEEDDDFYGLLDSLQGLIDGIRKPVDDILETVKRSQVRDEDLKQAVLEISRDLADSKANAGIEDVVTDIATNHNKLRKYAVGMNTVIEQHTTDISYLQDRMSAHNEEIAQLRALIDAERQTIGDVHDVDKETPPPSKPIAGPPRKKSVKWTQM